MGRAERDLRKLSSANPPRMVWPMPVAHLPELPLRLRGQGSLRCHLGLRVSIERKLFVDDSNISGKLLLKLFHGVHDL